MKKRPISIKIISLIYILLPLHIYAQIAYFSNTPLFEFYTVLTKSPIHSFILSFLWIAVGICIFMVKRWSFYVFIIHSISMICWNCYFIIKDPTFPIFLIIIFLLLLFVTTGFFLLEPVRSPYFNPRLRWWEQAKRYRVDLSVIIVYPENQIKGRTFDISKTGLFFIGELIGSTGDIINIRFEDELLSSVELSGEIVWITDGKGRYPQGGGIRFKNISISNKRKLSSLMKQINHR